MGRRRVEPRNWEDWYSPADYIGQANIIAREFCKAHPDADTTFVYSVATDAAMIYELGSVHSKFRLYVEIKIRTAIYNRRIRMNKFSQQVKNAIILDRLNGIPAEYPGQINDNVESDVKVFLPGDEVKQPDVIKPINVFAALLAMQQFINAIAEGAEITEAAASAGKDAHVSFSFGGTNYGLELRRLDS